MFGDELVHLMRQAAQQSESSLHPHVYGHIASYDPLQHRVRVVIPSMSDDDGSPFLSPWMPMGTMSSGAGYGVQVVYKGGASIDNPTAGEQVLVGMFDRRRGVAAVPCTFYHATNKPPATNLPKQSDGWPTDAAPISAGDILISGPPPAAGQPNTLCRFRGDSMDIELWGAAKLIANITGDANVTTTKGDINVTASKGNISATASEGNVSVTASQGSATVTASTMVTLVAPAIRLCGALTDTLHGLCTSLFRDWAVTHTHPNTGPPSTQPADGSLTTVVTGE